MTWLELVSVICSVSVIILFVFCIIESNTNYAVLNRLNQKIIQLENQMKIKGDEK